MALSGNHSSGPVPIVNEAGKLYFPVTAWQGSATWKGKAWGLRGCLIANAEDGAVFYRLWYERKRKRRMSIHWDRTEGFWVQQGTVNSSPMCCRCWRWRIRLLWTMCLGILCSLFQINKQSEMNEVQKGYKKAQPFLVKSDTVCS